MLSKRLTDNKDGKILCQMVMSVVKKESDGDSGSLEGQGNKHSGIKRP